MLSRFYAINLSLLFLSIISCPNSTDALDTDTGFDAWISHHVRRHKEKSEAVSLMLSTASNWKLNLAELDRTEITVSQDGAGNFTTITEAVNSIPLHNTRRVAISINSGVYREKVIPKTMRFVALVGDANVPPTITGNDTASTVRGRDGTPLKTFQSATVAIDADYFTAVNVKFENCYLNSVTKKVASVTAQKRSNSSISSGFSFKNCTVTGTGSIYLGRAWGDYSRVIFSYTFLDKIVLPQGWSDWGKKSRDEKVYYGEYKCSGGGANVTGRVPRVRVLTDEEALPFIGTYYIDGDTWLINPSTYYL